MIKPLTSSCGRGAASLIIAVALAGFSALSTAGDEKQETSPPKARTPETSARPGRKAALLAGVMNYAHRDLTGVRFTERDVDELAPLLESAGFQVVTMTAARGAKQPELNPTRENILRELRALTAKLAKDDLVLFGFAGKGVVPLNTATVYLCPRDADPKTVLAPAGTHRLPQAPDALLALDDVLKLLDESAAGKKLLLLDVSRTDPNVDETSTKTVIPARPLGLETSVLFGCGPGGLSYEHAQWGMGHGALFFSVIEGLRGAAASQPGDPITWDDLAVHVKRQVPQLVRSAYRAQGGVQSPNLAQNMSGAAPVIVGARTPPPKPQAPKDE